MFVCCNLFIHKNNFEHNGRVGVPETKKLSSEPYFDIFIKNNFFN